VSWLFAYAGYAPLQTDTIKVFSKYGDAGEYYAPVHSLGAADADTSLVMKVPAEIKGLLGQVFVSEGNEPTETQLKLLEDNETRLHPPRATVSGVILRGCGRRDSQENRESGGELEAHGGLANHRRLGSAILLMGPRRDCSRLDHSDLEHQSLDQSLTSRLNVWHSSASGATDPDMERRSC